MEHFEADATALNEIMVITAIKDLFENDKVVMIVVLTPMHSETVGNHPELVAMRDSNVNYYISFGFTPFNK